MQRAVLHAAALVALILCLVGPAAGAGELEAAKATGQVGEQVDGYLGLVTGDAPAPVRQLVERVNQGRRDRYAEIAARRGVSLEAVATQAGVKLIERASPGEFVKDSTGTWKRR